MDITDSQYWSGLHRGARGKITTVPKASGSPTTETGICAIAVEKNGDWKYVSDHALADHAP